MNSDLPEGVTEENIQHLMETRGISRPKAIGCAIDMRGLIEHAKMIRNGVSADDARESDKSS